MRISTLALCGVVVVVACEGRSTIQKGGAPTDTGGTGATGGSAGKGGRPRGGTGGSPITDGGTGARGGTAGMLDGGSGGRGGTSALGGDAGSDAGAGAVGGALGGGAGSGGDAGEGAGGAKGGTTGDAGTGGVAGDPGTGGIAGEPEPHKLPDGVCPDAAAWSPGAVQCRGGSFIHRPEALGCPLPARDPDDLPPDAGVDGTIEPACNQDKDCGETGYCVYVPDDEPRHDCVTPCASDTDCDAGEACLCASHTHNVNRETIGLGRCVPATCFTDADCGSGRFCRSPLEPASCLHDKRWPTGLSCQSPADECSGVEECPQTDASEYFTACMQAGDALACAPKRSWCE